MKKMIFVIPLLMLAIPVIGETQTTYTKDIRLLMEARCSNCHGSNAPLVGEFKKDREKYTKEKKGPRMDSYAHLVEFVKGNDAGAIMRRLGDGKKKEDKKPGHM